MPEQRLKSSQMMTIGAKELAILVVPKGWTANRSMRIVHVTPMIVARF
jgi:hypothetical protein